VPRKPHKPVEDVFLNIPYDQKFENLCLAYISGVSAFGLSARATLEIPGGARRLDRIFHLMQGCQYSVHDLSRVELDRKRPRTPRFNMPFELGMSVAWAQTGGGKNEWFVFESMYHRLAKSLSDLNGTDPYIHRGDGGGRVSGVMQRFRAVGPTANDPTDVGNLPGRQEEPTKDSTPGRGKLHLQREGVQGYLRGRKRVR
jgi:hypothetical protein